MNILIMGAGALGSYFGGRLQAAGHDVTYVARGAHLEAMQSRGLKIESGAGDLTLPDVRAVAHPSEGPQPDAVFFLVKNYDVETAAETLLPSLGPETFVVTGQNGVSAPDRLARVIGEERVTPGVVRMPADIRAPGVVRHPTDSDELWVGEFDGSSSDRVTGYIDAVNAAGMAGSVSLDIRAALWTKLIMLSGFSALTALTRLDIGPVRENPDTRALLIAALEETAAVGHAVCPTLGADALEDARDFLLEVAPPNVHASMLDDLNRGKRIELNYLSGDIVRIGKEVGVPTPTHAFVAAALAPFVDGAPG